MAAEQPLTHYQEIALQKMRARLLEWLPDHKLHLLLIRAPFLQPGTKLELTDPAFEHLLSVDPEAARQQLEEESIADQLFVRERMQQLEAERQASSSLVQAYTTKRHRRHLSRSAQARSAEQITISLP